MTETLRIAFEPQNEANAKDVIDGLVYHNIVQTGQETWYPVRYYLRGEGDTAVQHRATDQHDHRQDRQGMDQLVLAARLQPFARLAAGLGRGIDAMGGKGADGDGDRRTQCRDDDPALCCSGGHDSIAAAAAVFRQQSCRRR